MGQAPSDGGHLDFHGCCRGIECSSWPASSALSAPGQRSSRTRARIGASLPFRHFHYGWCQPVLAMFVCGENSWKPWLFSLAVDLSCLHKLQSKAALSKCEKDELLRRKATLLIYLLRSPFYDVYSKSKILSLLDDLARWIPGLQLVSGPLKDYLPVWQKMYSHNWSN